ncbi:MAG: hypothetical protein N2C14_32890 [Planctomycetales bacterium]
MTKSTDVRVLETRWETERIKYRTPIKFGGRVVEEAVLFHVQADVETRDGRVGRGFGSMPLSNVWAWPSDVVSTEQTLQAMIALAERLTVAGNDYRGQAHPLEIIADLEPYFQAEAETAAGDLGLDEAIPPLARLVAASPLDAALHDAFGVALNENSYNLLGPEFCNCDLGTFLTDEFNGEYLGQYTLREPKPTVPLYHLVGALDPLADDEVAQPVGDGLPETLGEWIAADQLTHLKIKLNGDDLSWDVDRVASVETVAAQAQQARGRDEWFYSLDFNEKCANVEYVLEFLAKTREKSPRALDRVQYIEQPTHRDLRAHPENRMHRAAEIKPVVIDESLIDLESLLDARDLGYSGVALKACKGHTGALLMGAAAQKHGMFLCVQDLTCPGASFLHSASLAARIPTVAAIEGNARQYCPIGNQGWDQRFPSMFQVQDGRLGTAALVGSGICLGETERPPQ